MLVAGNYEKVIQWCLHFLPWAAGLSCQSINQWRHSKIFTFCLLFKRPHSYFFSKKTHTRLDCTRGWRLEINCSNSKSSRSTLSKTDREEKDNALSMQRYLVFHVPCSGSLIPSLVYSPHLFREQDFNASNDVVRGPNTPLSQSDSGWVHPRHIGKGYKSEGTSDGD